MAVFRTHHETEYTVVSNKVLRDTNLSLKSIGLFIKMLSLPPNWDFSIQGLAKICKDGSSAVSSCLLELEEFGYLKRTRIYKDGKIADIEYDLYEIPVQDSTNTEIAVEEEIVEENPIQEPVGVEAAQPDVSEFEAFFFKNKNKKDMRTLLKWTSIKIQDKQIVDALCEWLKLMFANNKFQTLETYNTKLDSLFDKKGNLNVVDIIRDAIDKGYFSFTYSIDYLNKNGYKPKSTYQYTPAKVSTTGQPVKLNTDEVF